MKKSILVWMLILALLITACSGAQEAAEPSSEESSVVSAEVEQAEADKKAAEEAAAQAQAELDAAKAAEEQAKADAQKAAEDKAEAERLLAEAKTEEEKMKAEQLLADKIAAEQAASSAVKQAQQEKAAAEKAAADKAAAQKAAADKAAAEKAAAKKPSNSNNSTESNPFAKKITLKLYNAGAFNPSYLPPAKREDDPLRLKLEEAVNINLEMSIPPRDQILTKLNASIASGNIPDLIFFTDRATAIQYYQDGILANLSDYFDKYPKLKARFKASDWDALKYKGDLIGTPGYELVSGINGWWIRKDWLTSLNLNVPKTTTELLEVMKAFTFNDPDKNGKNDTYGFVAGVGKDGALINWDKVFWLFGAAPGIVDQIDGKIVYGDTNDRTKAALEFIKKMIDAGVVDPDWVTINDSAKLNQKLYQGKVGIIVNDWRRMEPAGQASMKEIGGMVPQWETIPPVKGPFGDQILDLEASQNNLWAVTSPNAKDPEKMDRIFRFLEYWYANDESYPYYAYGIKGVHWDMVDGKIKKFVLDKDTTEKNLWASNYWMPRKSTDGLYFNFQNPKTSEFHKINLTYVKTNKINPFVVPDPNDRFIADRKKYVNEMILKFMTGKEALSAWNQYIETLNTTFNYKEYKAFTEKSLRDNKIIK